MIVILFTGGTISMRSDGVSDCGAISNPLRATSSGAEATTCSTAAFGMGTARDSQCR